jgi:expansin
MAAMGKKVLLTGLLSTLLSFLWCGQQNGAERPNDFSIRHDCGDTTAIHNGEATYYTFADGSGNCCFDPTPANLMIGAMNHVDYTGSYVCGACVRIWGPGGDTVIRIVDQCPECPEGDIDLSPQAFSAIAAISLGRVPISWRLIACPVSGPIVYHFKDGSNQWWTAVQLRNHRYPVVTFEYLGPDGNFVNVPRTDYNYFVQASGMGAGPYTFRVTDYFGHVLTDSNIVAAADSSISGQQQFPECN